MIYLINFDINKPNILQKCFKLSSYKLTLANLPHRDKTSEKFLHSLAIKSFIKTFHSHY